MNVLNKELIIFLLFKSIKFKERLYLGACMNGGIMWFIAKCPGYIPGGTGPMGVGNIPGDTVEGPAPSWKMKIILNIN